MAERQLESEQTPKENMIILRNIRVRGKYTRDEHTSFPLLSRHEYSSATAEIPGATIVEERS